MKNTLQSLSVIFAVCAACYWAYFHYATHASTPATFPHQHYPLSWVNLNFDLSREEMAAVQHSHRAYHPMREQKYRELQSAKKKLIELPDSETPLTAQAIGEAHREVTRIEQECFDMTVDHIFKVSRLMNDPEGARYQKFMLSKLMHLEANDHSQIGILLEERP